MKEHFTFDQLDEAQFRARVQNNSAQTFLTMISIIQGVAFYFLINNAFPLFYSGALKVHREFLIYPALSFASIITVFFLYSWFVSITYRPPDIREAGIPFLVGLTQIFPMFCFEQPKHWFGFFAVFLGASIVALHNTLRGLSPRDFGERFRPAYDKSRHEELTNIAVCVILVCVSLAAFSFYPSGVLRFSWHDWVPMGFLFAGTAYLGWKSHFKYVNALYRIYGLLVPTNETPNHALQRTAPRVTVAASSGSNVTPPSHLSP